MIDLVRKFFGKSSEDEVLDHNGQTAHDVRIATCAILLEMANIDGEFTEMERENIISILKKNFDVVDEYAEELIKESNEEVERSIDLWQFAKLINQSYSIEEKIQIIENVWEIVYADGRLDKHEDYLVHKLANLLRLDHKQLIEAKLKVKKSRC
jgi:uncharacterized tellurite resistance protein B-like protein